MPYPHQPGSPYFDGAEAFEAYLDDQMRLIPCPDCSGAGVTGFRVTVYEHGCGFPHDDTDERPCEHCGGSGSTVIRVEPITLDDLYR